MRVIIDILLFSDEFEDAGEGGTKKQLRITVPCFSFDFVDYICFKYLSIRCLGGMDSKVEWIRKFCVTTS